MVAGGGNICRMGDYVFEPVSVAKEQYLLFPLNRKL